VIHIAKNNPSSNKKHISTTNCLIERKFLFERLSVGLWLSQTRETSIEK
jgi:hypothetical protein